jgi:hypothetical protein
MELELFLMASIKKISIFDTCNRIFVGGRTTLAPVNI